MKQMIRLGLIVAGAAAFTMTAANAKCAGGKEAPKTMKCQAGKCGAGKAKEKGMGKCNGDKAKEKAKEGMKKGKCGQGKCGGK